MSFAAPAAPTSWAAAGLSAAGNIFQGITNSENAISQGESTQNADNFKAQQLINAATIGQTQADQTDAYLRQQTGATLAKNAAVLGATNTDPNSPSSVAVQNRTEAVGDTDRQTKVGSIEAQVAQDQQASAYYTMAGANAMQIAQQNSSNSIFGGILGGLGSLASSFAGPSLSSAASSVGNAILPLLALA